MSKVRSLNPRSTYSLAHTAQCKLQMSAKHGDRDLRFTLGHAFTLDNLMLRIIEIENDSAKSEFLEGRAPSDDGMPHYDCTKPAPIPAEPDSRGRRISFQDNNARPSNILGGGKDNGGTSPARKRSPPPASLSAKHDSLDDKDSDGTSSDDYDDPATALDFDDDEVDPLGNDADGGDLSLTRFESASAQPPRMIRSGSSSSEEDDDGPVSPPQLPADVDVRELIGGDKDEELVGLYNNVRRCPCHGHHEDSEEPQGIWDLPAEKTGGRRLAVMAMAA